MVKPDRMISRYIWSVFPHIKKHSDMVELVRRASDELRVSYPILCPRALDHSIWEYQRK